MEYKKSVITMGRIIERAKTEKELSNSLRMLGQLFSEIVRDGQGERYHLMVKTLYEKVLSKMYNKRVIIR